MYQNAVCNRQKDTTEEEEEDYGEELKEEEEEEAAHLSADYHGKFQILSNGLIIH